MAAWLPQSLGSPRGDTDVMHAVASGPVSVPIGEQLLWRGSPDPGRLIRRWLRSSAGGAVLQLVGLAVFLMVAGVFMQFGSSVLWIIGPFALVSVVPLLRQYGRSRREARTTSYLLTDQRVLLKSILRDLEAASLTHSWVVLNREMFTEFL